MSLYGDLPPPTHSAPNVDKEETQQSAMETQSTSSKSKSALPVGWTPGTLRFMPTIQRKPVIQAKPKLTPKVPVTSPNPPAVSTSPNQNIVTTSSLNSVVSTPPPVAVSTDSEPIATPSSTSISSPKQSLGSEDVNDYKAFVNNQRNQRSAFEKGKKQGKGVKRQAPLSMEDDYDPTRPNDYEEYKEYEKKRKEIAYHEEHSRRRSMSPEPRQRTPPRSFPPPPTLYSETQSSAAETSVQEIPRPRTPPAKIDLDITGEEAFLRRARLSNQTAQKSPEPKPSSGLSSGEDFAHRILAKYGWQEGQGLGKNEQGINEPLKVQKTDYRSGIIVNTSTNIPAQAKSDPIPSNVEVPSRVILLTNMVGPGEVDDTLQEETADECNEKYGTVERCLIFEVPHGKLPDDQAVRIFVKFEAQAAALKAKKDLNGRFFGGRSVTAKFFDESRFDKYDLAPSPAEIQKAKQKE
ncbi:3164_t:CDS:2 [Dentiscutata heterogama]|uniref:3164_t:CDS:1 n=1 Tax=Dentiscutata heterogama TaxID=1316150 RepID=A0ACA9KNS0_9GLOM|nr:3164_t:CDS:2 [Dentiscutata heterogama]